MDVPSPSDLVAVSRPRSVGLITGAHAVNEFYSVALPPVLPLLVADLSISYAKAGALVTVFYLVYSVFQLPAGVLSDRVGKKWLLAVGMVGLAAGMLLAGAAEGYPTLVAAEVVAGIGGSTYHPTGMSLISDLETGGTEGRAMGIHGVGGVAGTALAPALIGGLAAAFDWRLALGASAVVGAGYAALFAVGFDEPPREDDDGSGNSKGQPGWLAAPRDRLAALVNVPLAPWIVVLFAANFLFAVEIGGVRTFTTSYVFARVGGTALANAVFFSMLVGGGIASLGAGHLADTLDRRLLGAGAFLLGAVFLAATWFLPARGPLLVAWFFVLGTATYGALPAINALTSAYADRGSSGSLFGVMLTAGSLGGAVGPAAFGIAAERLGLALAFPLVAVVGVAGAVAMLLLFRAEPRGATEE